MIKILAIAAFLLSFVVAENELYLYAVGGDNTMRKERVQLINAIKREQPLNAVNLYLDNEGYRGMAIPGIVSWISQIMNFDAPVDESRVSDLQLTGAKENYVFLCGYMDNLDKNGPSEFNDLTMDRIGYIDKLGLQGPGFNYIAPPKNKVQEKFGAKYFSETSAKTEGNNFNEQKWNDLISKYPRVLQDLVIINKAGFFLTRSSEDGFIKQRGEPPISTEAFSRQFNLDDFIRENKYHTEFELAVARGLREKNIEGIEILIKTLEEIPELTKGGLDKEEFHEYFKKISEIYRRWKETFFDTIRSEEEKNRVIVLFDESITAAITNFMPYRAREYDAYAFHMWARSIAGMNVGDSKLEKIFFLHGNDENEVVANIHFILLKLALGDVDAILEMKTEYMREAVAEYIENLREAFSNVRVHILHDLGLDPQADDYLAIKLAEFLLF